MRYYYICAVFTFISAAVSFGFSIDALGKAKREKALAVVNAKYAAARSLSLFLVAIGLFVFASPAYLIALSAVMIGVQLFDGVIGIKISLFKTVGPFITAVGNAVVLVLFLLND